MSARISVRRLAYVVGDDSCEIVSLASGVQGRGVGLALVAAVKALGHARLWVTTNDIEAAIAFSRRRRCEIV